MFGTGLFANVMPEKLARTLRLFRLADGLAGDPEPVEPGSFASIGALEVQHLEKWLMARPDLLGEELMIVASQFSGFDRTQDRPDLLRSTGRGKLSSSRSSGTLLEAGRTCKPFDTPHMCLR